MYSDENRTFCNSVNRNYLHNKNRTSLNEHFQLTTYNIWPNEIITEKNKECGMCCTIKKKRRDHTFQIHPSETNPNKKKMIKLEIVSHIVMGVYTDSSIEWRITDTRFFIHFTFFVLFIRFLVSRLICNCEYFYIKVFGFLYGVVIQTPYAQYIQKRQLI